MAAPSKNPLIDRYYSPLATMPDVDGYRREIDTVLQTAIRLTEEKITRAANAGRIDEVSELEEQLRELRLQAV